MNTRMLLASVLLACAALVTLPGRATRATFDVYGPDNEPLQTSIVKQSG